MKNTLISSVTALFLMFSAASIYAQDASKTVAVVNQPVTTDQVGVKGGMQGNGRLVVDIKEFSSEVVLKKKIEDLLKSGGLEWGAKDGMVVFTMVSKRFVNFDMPNFTRYGTQTEIELPAGNYSITGIGFIPTTSFSAEKALNKGAYINDKVMSFTLQPGKTTTISVKPIIQKNATFFINFFLPELLTSITSDGVTGSPVSVIAKTEASLPWATYTGPLKFKTK